MTLRRLRCIGGSPHDHCASLPLGSVVIYDARAWHRGGANKSGKPRPLYYLTVVDDGCAPPMGLPYTIEPSEVACFSLSPKGVRRRGTRRCQGAT